MGDPVYQAGRVAEVSGFGGFDGRYFIDQVVHSLRKPVWHKAGRIKIFSYDKTLFPFIKLLEGKQKHSLPVIYAVRSQLHLT